MHKRGDSLGGRIYLSRKAKGLSQERLAEMLFMKKSTISAYENNINDVPSKVLIQLANALDTSPEYLLEGRSELASSKITNLFNKIESEAHRVMALNQIRCIVDAENGNC